jgi:hypothetical protein
VNFLNDANGGYYPAGTPLAPNADPSQQWALDTADRNLYVMNASLNGGANASNTPWELSSSGTQHFSVTSGSGSAPSTSDTISASAAAPSTDSLSFLAAPNSSTTAAAPTTSTTTSGGDSSTSLASAASGGTADFTTPAANAAYASDSTSGSSGAWTQYSPDQSTVAATHT